MQDSRNVILFVFDTLRPDFLSCYGGEAVETPNIDSIAENGVRFENTFSVGPGTPISHGGLFTGRYPSNSGVTGQYISLPKEHPTLAEWFQSHGYYTTGIAGPSKIASDFGYDRGFEHYFEPYYDIGYRDRRPTPEYFKNALTDWDLFKNGLRTAFRGEAKNTRFKFDHLRQEIKANDGPVFGFANLLEAHAPYYPPHGYRSRFDPEFTEPPMFVIEHLLNRRGSHANPNVRLDRVNLVQKAEGLGRFIGDPSYLNEDELDVMRRWYAASIKYLDEEFGRFLRFYEQTMADDTYLVVTADHGEQFGEHGLLGHSHYLFDETVHVPLLIRGPELPEGETVENLTSLVDIYDTVSNLANIERPTFTDGQCMFDDEPRDMVFMEHGQRDIAEFRDTPHARYSSEEGVAQLAAGRKAVRTADHKLVMDSNGTETLYDVHTISETEVTDDDVKRSLREKLTATLSDDYGVWPEGDPSEYNLNEDVVDNLKDLGYI